MTGSSLASCELCPRQCGVNRAAGCRGFCRAGNVPVVFRYGPHHGEEPPVSGTRGSGTVFFSHCTLACLYCQNYPWSQQDQGEFLPVPRLAAALRSLVDAGCHNINLVSPTPWLPWIREALEVVHRTFPHVPVVYNTSGYERVDTLRQYEGLARIYLTDLRYASDETARTASGVGDYVPTARAALLEMARQAGPMELDAEGLAVAGVICRILVLPGHADEAVANLEWIANHVGNEVAVSLMAQYVPAHRALAAQPWNRRVTRNEYERVTDAMERLGLCTGWIQEHENAGPDDLVGFNMPAGGGKAVPEAKGEAAETE